MSEDDAMRRGVVGVLLVALVAALLVALAPPAAVCSCADTGTPPVAFEGVALGRTGSRDFDERWAF